MNETKELCGVDIKENYIYSLDKAILSLLLKDRSSGKNIIWATGTYAWRGIGFEPQNHITVNSITGKRGNVIKPRTQKSQKEQRKRIKNKAEVFTPSWVCCEMANNFDAVWFGRENVFNTPSGETRKINENKIEFDFNDCNAWQDYVRLKVLEISCGEAPFLASRYDTVSGVWLDIKDRIGLLDRKLRIISENTNSEKDWVTWAFEAYKATYGYEWQGDSLLIARENLLFTFIDYYVAHFDNYPIKEYLIEIAKILSWNIWQMDGLKGVIPYSCKPLPRLQLSLFDDFNNPPQECPGCLSNNNRMHTGIYCKIKNWKSNKNIDFISVQGDKKMKFDFVIGNPPYQEESGGTKIADDSLFHYFMDAAYSISNRVELITPSKFLFNNGNTPTAWNKKMLNDVHFKVLRYEPVASKIFPGLSFKGGVAIHYRDANAMYEPILQFTEFSELNSILRKVLRFKETSLTTIIHNQNKFNLDNLYSDFPELKTIISSNGRERRMTSGCLTYSCFHIEKETDDDIQILGVINNKRTKRYINRKYLEEPNVNIDKFKVIIPANNGSGAIGEVLSTPLIGEPLIGYTQTFIAVGAFDTYDESSHALKYVKSKFCRTMLGILKVTQNGKREMWQYIPIQDFTENSDIDWSKSVREIDLQLYKKYGLDENEIAFIESHIKEMN